MNSPEEKQNFPKNRCLGFVTDENREIVFTYNDTKELDEFFKNKTM